MGLNAQIAVPSFTAGQVLTAAQQTQINTGIPVFATTVTRDAAFGGAGEKTLAEGQFAYIEATNTTQYYDGSAWQVVGASGLVLIKTQTIGTTVGSVTVTGAFSATYDNYFITVNGGTCTGNNDLNMTLGATATGYHTAGYFMTSNSSTVGGTNTNNGTSWVSVGAATTNTLNMEMFLYEPNLAKRTVFNSRMVKAIGNMPCVSLQGYVDNATQYTDFTLTASGGTVTGGTIRVYGYAIS